MCSTSTATTWPRSTSALDRRARGRGSPVAHRRPHPHRLRQSRRSRTRFRRTASRSAPTRCVRPSARWGGPTSRRSTCPTTRCASFGRRSSAAPRSRPPGSAAWTPMRRVIPTRPATSRAPWPGELPDGWQAHLPVFTPADGEMATRDAGGKVLAALAAVVTNLVGGSADLDPSTRTAMKDRGDFESPRGRRDRRRSEDTGEGRRRVELRRPQHPFRRARARRWPRR